jgi:alpha-glucosidase
MPPNCIQRHLAVGLLFAALSGSAHAAVISVGNITGVTVTTNSPSGNWTASFALSTGGSVEITPYAPDLVRVSFHWVGPFSTEEIMIDKAYTNWPAAGATLTDQGTHYLITTPHLDVEIQKTPFKVHFKDKTGFYLLQDDFTEYDDAYNFTGQSANTVSKLKCHKVMPSGQAYFGLGEFGGPMNRRGQSLECYNTGTYQWGEFTNPTYLNVPFFYGVQPAAGGNPPFVYGLFFHNPCRPRFKFGTENGSRYSFQAGDGRMDYFFFGGGASHTFAKVIDRFSELTGRATLLPRWGLGHHLSKFSYSNRPWVEYIANQSTVEDMPLDAVYLDIDYMDANADNNISDGQLRQLTFNSNFPNPADMVSYCHARGVKVVPLIEPWLQPGDSFYGEANGLLHFIKDNASATVTRNIYVGAVSWFDYSSTPMQDWWRGKIATWYGGVPMDGIWNDLTEPEGGNQIPYNGLLWCDGRYGDVSTDSRRQWSNEHNLFGLRCAQQSYRTMQQIAPNRRPFVLSRSGNAGLQRYAVSWSGDTGANWFYQRTTIRFGMGAMIAGIGWYGNDVGGFVGNPGDELLVRSYEFNCLTPFFRNHADKGAADREPWRFTEPTKSRLRDLIKLRYRLMPYLYTLAYEFTQTGEPMNVPPVFDYYHDVNTYSLNDYDFLVGDYILAAPVYNQGATTRAVYLPFAPGVDWYYWPSGQPNVQPAGTRYSGGQTVTVSAPLGSMPMFVRSGAILPMGPSMQFANQFQSPWMDINCWPDGNSEFTLHEDDGVTWNVLTGGYARAHMTSSRAGQTWNFNIGARQGSYHPGNRDYYVYCFNPPTSAVQSITWNGNPLNQLANFSDAPQGWQMTPEGRLGIKVPDTGAAAALHVAWAATNNAVQFAAPSYSASETSGFVRVYVARIGDASGAVSVHIATSNGTALAGADYAATNATLQWSGGDGDDKFFDVVLLDDDEHEDDETFDLILSGVSGAGLGSPSLATVTVSDNELPPGVLRFSASAYPASETGDTVRIFVNRVQGSAGPASVAAATADGTATAGADYQATNVVLHWADGEETNRFFDVIILDDPDHEGDENFTVVLSDPTGAGLGSPSTATVTIADNELPPGTVQFSAADYAVAETSGFVRLTVTRAGGAGGAASVHYASADGTAFAGSDYTAVTGILQWADGESSNQFIDVSIADDGAYELAEFFSVHLTGAVGPLLGNPSSAVVTITAPALPELVVTNPPAPISVSAAAYNLQGVANVSNWVGLAWSNSLTGATGQGPIGTFWTLAGVPLAVGTNVITVTATNVGVGANASDSGTNAAYISGWTNGANGGVGWAGGWQIITGVNAGVFIAGANANNSAGTRAWGMWASGGSISDVRRPLPAPLAVGQELSLRLDNNWIQNGGSVGFGLQNAAGANLFEFFFVGGASFYTINDKLTNRNTGIGYDDAGWDITFQLTNSTQYRFTCGAHMLSGTINSNADQNLVRFRAFNFNGGGGSNFDFFFNRLAVAGGAGGAGPATGQVVEIVRLASAIPQDWRDRYDLTGPDSGDDDDRDGDGLSNLQEYWADTVPTNSASTFDQMRVPAEGAASNGIFTLQVPPPTTNSRLYDVSFGSNLLDGLWWPYGFNTPGRDDGGGLTFTVTNAVDDHLFYYIRVFPP